MKTEHEWEEMDTAPKDGTIIFGRLYFDGTPGTFRVKFHNGNWRHADGVSVAAPKQWRPLPRAARNEAPTPPPEAARPTKETDAVISNAIAFGGTDRNGKKRDSSAQVNARIAANLPPFARRLEIERDALRVALAEFGESHADYVARVNKGAELPPNLKEQSIALVRYANTQPTLLSLLYDMNLMPEQLEEGSFRWGQMVNIIGHFQQAIETALATKP